MSRAERVGTDLGRGPTKQMGLYGASVIGSGTGRGLRTTGLPGAALARRGRVDGLSKGAGPPKRSASAALLEGAVGLDVTEGVG